MLQILRCVTVDPVTSEHSPVQPVQYGRNSMNPLAYKALKIGEL